MTHNEIIAVIAAHRDGKAVEWKLKIQRGDVWRDSKKEDEPWNFVVADYRIKPEPTKPREWWIYPVYGDSDCAIETSPTAGFVHVREVLPE